MCDTRSGAQKSRCWAQLDRPEASACGQIDDDKLSAIFGQCQIEYETVCPSGHRFDPRPLRNIDRGRSEGARRTAAVRYPANNDRDQNGKAADQHDSHYHDQGFESAHLF